MRTFERYLGSGLLDERAVVTFPGRLRIYRREIGMRALPTMPCHTQRVAKQRDYQRVVDGLLERGFVEVTA